MPAGDLIKTIPSHRIYLLPVFFYVLKESGKIGLDAFI